MVKIIKEKGRLSLLQNSSGKGVFMVVPTETEAVDVGGGEYRLILPSEGGPTAIVVVPERKEGDPTAREEDGNDMEVQKKP